MRSTRDPPSGQNTDVRPRLHVRILAAAAVAVALILPAGTPAIGTSAGALAHASNWLSTPASVRERRVDLLRAGDFVSQRTDVACVGASVQLMLNMIRPVADRSASGQQLAQRTAQAMSDPVFVRRSGGASALGWAYALERLGGGPYRVRAFSSRTEALRAVATAIAATGRPAGLLVWAGVHAWVVSGFRSVGDPASDPAFRLVTLTVEDPWWPRQTNSHGRTLAPGTELTPDALTPHFVLYHRGRRGVGNLLNGSFVVVLPLDPAAVAERAAGLR